MKPTDAMKDGMSVAFKGTKIPAQNICIAYGLNTLNWGKDYRKLKLTQTKLLTV
jgi:hypothetical protein